MPVTLKFKRSSAESGGAPESNPRADENTEEEKRKTLISKKMPSETLQLSTTPLPNYPILWWTDIPAAEQAHLQTNDCGLPYTCTWTQDRGLLEQTTVLVFSSSSLGPSDTLPPTPRNTSQAWVLYAVPPSSAQNPEMDEVLPILGLTHAWSNLLQADFVVDTFLDMEAPLATTTTATASIPDAVVGPVQVGVRFMSVNDGEQRETGIGTWPVSVGNGQGEPAGKTKRAEPATSVPVTGSILEEVIKAPWVDLAEKNRMRKLSKEQGGKAAVAWIVRKDPGADCSVPSKSGRENYVRELLKVMDVDIYGDCMGNTPWPIHQDTQLPYTQQEVIADYKFYLALESANCQDYVTNSLVQALVVGAVPIVDGPKNYTRFSPTGNALVRVDSFLAPELMAQELNALDQEDTVYMTRLGYRSLKNNNVITPPQTKLSPLFVDTFKVAFSGLSNTATVGEKTTYRPDRNGAHCGICQLAHDLAVSQYNWSSSATASVTNRVAVCEREPRYLPGLPTQMKAYDEYLQKEQEHFGPPTLSPPLPLDNSTDPSIPINTSNSHSVNVTVSLVKSDSSTESWIDPTVHIEPQNNQPPLQGTLTSQELSIDTLTSKGSVPMNAPPASEMIYLALLILVLVIGVTALLLATSKEARRIATWPFRHLFYKKVPLHDRREAQRRQQMSLERIMLSELGEDLLYE